MWPTVLSVILLAFGLIFYLVYQPGMEYVSKPSEDTLELDLQPDKSLSDEIDKLERQVINDPSYTKANDNGIPDTSSSTTAVEFGISETEQDSVSVKSVDEMSSISTEETVDGGEHQELEQSENKHSSDFNRCDSVYKTIKDSEELKASKLKVVDQSLTYHTKNTLSDGKQDGNIETEDISKKEENRYQANGNDKHYGITPNDFPQCHLQAHDGNENPSTEINKNQSSDDHKELPFVNKEMSHELEFSVQMIILQTMFEFLVSLTRTITDFVKSCAVVIFDVIEVVVCKIIHLVRYVVLSFLEVPYCIVMFCKCILEMYITILAFLWFACLLQLAIFLFYVITFVCALLTVILNMKALSIIKFEIPNSFSDIHLAFEKIKTAYQRCLAVKMSSFMTGYVVVGISGILIASLVTLAFTQYFLAFFVALATVFYWIVGLFGPCLLCKYRYLTPYAHTLSRWINIPVSPLDVHVSKIINVKSLNGLLLKIPVYKIDRKSKPGTACLKKRKSTNSNEESASIETTGKLRKKTGDRDINSDIEVGGNTKYKTEPRMQKILGSCEKCTKNTPLTTLYPCEHKFCSSCFENTTKGRCTACGKEYIFSI